MRKKEPLYRSVAHTWGVVHGRGEFRWSRHKKRADQTTAGSMHSGNRNGRDYTPLFRFLLSKVGENWDGIYSEAIARLDRADPIFWIVARSELERKAIVVIGENSLYSGLYVDNDNLLRIVDPSAQPENIGGVWYGTTTFNGQPFTPKLRD
jgi:hypothetical protein